MIRQHIFASLPILVWAFWSYGIGILVFSVPSNADDGDKYNCSLNASSPFSHVVMIWDYYKFATMYHDGTNGSVTMGSLITCNAVLTTAYYYVNKVLADKALFEKLGKWNRLRVIGQYIYDRSSGAGREHPCYQNMSVTTVEVHPKTSVKGERILFDYAIVVMPRPFIVISPAFPTMFFPTSTLELIQNIRYVNIVQSETFCTVPTPETFDVLAWIFNERVDVHTKPFHSQCMKRICEQKVQGGGSQEKPECERVLGERLNATMLCMVPYFLRLASIKVNWDGTLWPNPIAGAPLICNGSTLGMTNFAKLRARESYPEYQQDLYFVITLLRVLPWLIDKIKVHTPEIDPFYIEDKGLTRQDITEPSRLTTEDWGFGSFYALPYGDSPFPTRVTIVPDSLAPPTFRCSIFSTTLLTSLLLHVWHSL